MQVLESDSDRTCRFSEARSLVAGGVGETARVFGVKRRHLLQSGVAGLARADLQAIDGQRPVRLFALRDPTMPLL